MAFREILAGRIRESLSHVSNLEEKKKMGGLSFMINAKVCVRVEGDELMCRID